MPQNMTENTVDEMMAFAYMTFMDGIVQGQPVAKTVSYIIDNAVMFGKDEAKRRLRPESPSHYEDINDLKRDATATVVEGLFGSKGLKTVLRGAVKTAIDYGFKRDVLLRGDTFAALEKAFDAVREDITHGEVSEDNVEAFFAETVKFKDFREIEVAILYVKELLAGKAISPSMMMKLPSFKAFQDRYLNVMVG